MFISCYTGNSNSGLLKIFLRENSNNPKDMGGDVCVSVGEKEYNACPYSHPGLLESRQ